MITQDKISCEKYKGCRTSIIQKYYKTTHTVFKSYAYRQQVTWLQIIQTLQYHQHIKMSTHLSIFIIMLWNELFVLQSCECTWQNAKSFDASIMHTSLKTRKVDNLTLKSHLLIVCILLSFEIFNYVKWKSLVKMYIHMEDVKVLTLKLNQHAFLGFAPTTILTFSVD